MRPSTTILWHMKLWQAGLCAVLLAGLCFLIGILGGVGIHLGPAFATALACLMTVMLGPRVFLLRLARFFPVDERQLAWLPLSFFGLIWLAGTGGLLAGQCLSTVGFEEGRWNGLAGFWATELARIPLMLFIILALLQYSNMGGFWQLYLAGGILYLVNGNEPSAVPSGPLGILEILFFIGGSAVLILAAPAYWAGLLRQTIKWHEGESLRSPYSIEEGGRKRSTSLLDLAEALIALPVVCVILRLLWEYGPGFVRNRVVEITSGHFGIEDIWLLLLLRYSLIDLPVAVINVYAQARASGFAPDRALLLTLLRLTFVLAPLARRLGLKRGKLISCPACGRKKIVWQSHCPHCQGNHAENLPSQPWGAAPQWPQTNPAPGDWRSRGALDETFVYRYFIPGFLIIIAMILRG